MILYQGIILRNTTKQAKLILASLICHYWRLKLSHTMVIHSIHSPLHLVIEFVFSSSRLPWQPTPSPAMCRLTLILKCRLSRSTLSHKHIAFSIFDFVYFRYQIARLAISNHHQGLWIDNSQVHANISNDIYYVLVLIVLRLQTCFKSLASFFNSYYKLNKCWFLLLSLQERFFILNLRFNFTKLHFLTPSFISISWLCLLSLNLLLVWLCKHKSLAILKFTHLWLSFLYPIKASWIAHDSSSEPLALTLAFTLCIIEVHNWFDPLVEYVSLSLGHLLQQHLLFSLRLLSLLLTVPSSVDLWIILVFMLSTPVVVVSVRAQFSFDVLRYGPTKSVDSSLLWVSRHDKIKNYTKI